MIIESIKLKSKKNANIFNVVADGNTFVLHSDAIVKFGIATNKEVEAGQFFKAVKESDYIICLNVATNYMGSRLRTLKQLKDYLTTKGFNYETINIVLEKLGEYKVVNDEEFSKSFIKVNSTKYSKKMIQQKLQQKGVKKQDFVESLQEIDDKETCVHFAKKFLKNKDITKEMLEKLVRHLQYKGFNFEDINYALKYLKISEEL